MQSHQRFGRAVIIGGSVAGLLGARILADHFEQVIVIERDPVPSGPDPRKSVPQSRHLHGLLAAGRELIDTLFPGLVQEMLNEGAELADMGRDTAWFHAGAWKARYISGIISILSSRTFLEWKIRGRVSALPNVSIRYECSVDELLADSARTRITGVKLKTSGGEETLEADLIVDAGGRGARSQRWLEALGFGRPEEEKVVVNLSYTSRLYEPSPDYQRDWKFLFLNPRPPGAWRTGLVQNVEGGRWMVTLIGCFGDSAPTDEQGFQEYARSLPTPDLYEAIQHARPLTDPAVHKIPSNRWLHYERMANFPDGFVTYGDAVCAFNPIYGQGMTVAGLSARLLGECVAEQAKSSPGNLQGLSRRFQQKLAKLLQGPWLMASSLDLKFPQTEGRRFAGLGVLHWVLDTVADLTSLNTEASRRFYAVTHMQSGPEAMLSPGFLTSFFAYGIKSLFVPLPQRVNLDTRPPAPS